MSPCYTVVSSIGRNPKYLLRLPKVLVRNILANPLIIGFQQRCAFLQLHLNIKILLSII